MELGKQVGEQPNGERWFWRYWNANGYATAIVAVVTLGVDWAAYIGGGPTRRESDCVVEVARHGSKLSEEDARHFFPQVELPYRW